MNESGTLGASAGSTEAIVESSGSVHLSFTAAMTARYLGFLPSAP
jgi:hypothetical protein